MAHNVRRYVHVAAAWGVAWVFAIVLNVEIFQVHEIIEKSKNHDPPTGGGAPRRSAGASRLVFGGGASR